MSKAKILTFAATLSFVGASFVGASNVQARECYRVKPHPAEKAAEPGKPIHWLEIRKRDDWKEPTDLLYGLAKFEQHKVEKSGLIEVTTITSIVGGDKATHGWIEEKSKDERAITCYAATPLVP